MRIYLDNCCIQRLLDTRVSLRVSLEAEAILYLIGLFEAREADVLASDALLYEVKRNPNPARRDHGLQVPGLAKVWISADSEVETLARRFRGRGLDTLDALHLASAEVAGSDFFCTCDDGLLRKARLISDLQTRVVSPMELAEEVQK